MRGLHAWSYRSKRGRHLIPSSDKAEGAALVCHLRCLVRLLSGTSFRLCVAYAFEDGYLSQYVAT